LIIAILPFSHSCIVFLLEHVFYSCAGGCFLLCFLNDYPACFCSDMSLVSVGFLYSASIDVGLEQMFALSRRATFRARSDREARYGKQGFERQDEFEDVAFGLGEHQLRRSVLAEDR
jgi:hypothetical protein